MEKLWEIMQIMEKYFFYICLAAHRKSFQVSCSKNYFNVPKLALNIHIHNIHICKQNM
jgi:hypothetical protein